MRRWRAPLSGLLLAGCTGAEPEPDAPPDPQDSAHTDSGHDTGSTDSAAPPATATAHVGPIGTLLTASRALGAGEAWTAPEGVEVIPLDASTAYAEGVGPFAVIDASGTVLASATEQAVAFSLGVDTPEQPVLLSPGHMLPIQLRAATDLDTLAFVADGAIVTGTGNDGLRAGRAVFEGALDGPQVEQHIVGLAVTARPDLLLASETISIAQTGHASYWGDLHSHSNLSHDGCEDVDNDCLPRSETPALDAVAHAEAAGLDFFALTEHAEYLSWSNLSTGATVDIWSEEQRIALDAETRGMVVIPGYEWTGGYGTGGHRTVLFDAAELCPQQFVRAQERDTVERPNGIEVYAPSTGVLARYPAELLAALAPSPECPATSVSYFHHPAYEMPRMVDWTSTDNLGLGDTVVEIYSEHGSSECDDPAVRYCDFGVNLDTYTGNGSVQTALASGLDLGFVGGTDNHASKPGSVLDGPSGIYTSAGWTEHTTGGSLTRVFSPADAPFHRASILQALRLRRTSASTYRFQRADALLLCGETAYLPGDDVPPDTVCTLLLALEDAAILSAEVDFLDRTGWADTVRLAEEGAYRAEVTLAPGELLYLRVRATLADGIEQRGWFSPWFAQASARR
jgi:hypothetical protein